MSVRCRRLVAGPLMCALVVFWTHSVSAQNGRPERRPADPGSPAGSQDLVIDSAVSALAGRILDRSDKDKSGVLEEAEWSQMIVKPNDYDGDGRITKDELAKKIAADRAAKSRRVNAARSPSSSNPASVTGTGDEKPVGDQSPAAPEPSEQSTDTTAVPSSSRASSDDAKPRRSYRFLTPRERLPGGLPSFFAGSDRDGDGQVMMFEFATNWTDAKVREFARYDLNNDGIITAAECIRQQQRD